MTRPGPRRFGLRQVVGLAALILVIAAIAVAWGRIDLRTIHDEAARLNGTAVFLALTFLPMVGFPVSVLHVAAGVRFGTGLGLLLVSASILIQLLVSYALVRALPDFFGRRLEPLRRRLPDAAHRPVTLFTLFLPGAPYFAQNYVLPLIGVPLGTYLFWGFPIHALRSVAGIAFGDLSDRLTPGRIAAFVVYGIGISLACAWSFRSLRAQLQGRSRAEDDPTRPPSDRSAGPGPRGR